MDIASRLEIPSTCILIVAIWGVGEGGILWLPQLSKRFLDEFMGFMTLSNCKF